MVVKFHFKVKLISVGDFFFACFVGCVCFFLLASLFSGNTYLEMLSVGGSYASITVDVTALSSFLRFLPHTAPHRSHCLQLWHG